MSPPRGRRAGMAILSVELDETDPRRVLIRVKTVADVIDGEEPTERAFASSAQAVAYLRDWLDAWTAER